jgi:hypothetical protein
LIDSGLRRPAKGPAEGVVVGPDEAKAFAAFFFAQSGKWNAEASGVGKGKVSFTGLGKVSVDFKAFADVNDDEERRSGFVGGESANVTLGLAPSGGHGVVPLIGAASGAGTFAGSEGLAAREAISTGVSLGWGA